MIQVVGEHAKKFFDRQVQDQPRYNIGDYVLLRSEHIAITSPSKKLGPKFLGPFRIISKLSDLVYQLKLPTTLRIHNVFHVAVLEPYRSDTISGRRQVSPPPVVTPAGDLQ